MQAAHGRDRIAHFLIAETLGEGGMGIVYKARDEKLGRIVALKVLRPRPMRERERKLRFLREARTAASLTHRSVAAVYEVGEEDDAVYIAMEYIEGQTLRRHMAGKPIPLDEALGFALEIADGVAHAHKGGIVHRDLKPDNVMVAVDGHIKILDFGIAKLVATGEESAEAADGSAPTELRTRDGVAFGTPGYMSPEQIRGLPVDHRTDIYSFGAMLHEMVTARVPLRGATEMDTVAAVLREVAPPPSQLSAGLPADIDFIVGKCLEKDPDDRYQSCAELTVDLRRLRRTTTGPASAPVPVSGPASANKSAPPVAAAAAAPAPAAATAPVSAAATAAAAAAAAATAPVSAAAAAPAPAAAPVSVSAPAAAPLRPRLLRPAAIAAIAAAAIVAAVAWRLTRHGASSSPPDTAPPVAPPSAASAAAVPAPRPAPVSRRITANPPERSVYSVALSPDGRLVAYIEGFSAFVRAVDVEGARPLPLPRGSEPYDVAWLPDGAHLIVGVFLDGKFSLWTVALFGEAPVALREGAWLGTPSRDGRDVAFVSERGVEAMSAGGEDARVLIPLAAGEKAVAVAWSPDGNRVAALLHGDRQASIESAGAAGGDRAVILEDRRLFRKLPGAAGLLWMADGRVVYGLGESDDRMTLWGIAVGADGRPAGKAEPLLALEGHYATYLSASADGKRVAYVRNDAQEDVYVGDLDGRGRLRAPARMTVDDRFDRPWAWNGDGVIFVSSRRGNRDIFVQRPADAEPAPLVAAPGDDDAPAVTPDHRFLLFWRSAGAVGADGAAADLRLMRAPLAGGAPDTVLRSGQAAAADALQLAVRCPSRAGTCVLSELGGGQMVFYDLDPERGKGAEVARATSLGSEAGWDVSPDGATIAVVSAYRQIQLHPRGGGPVREVKVAYTGELQFAAWAPDGRGLYATGLSAETTDFEVLEVGLDGRVRPLWREKLGWLSQPAPSGDGKRLAVGVRMLDADVWMIEGL